MAKLAGVCDDLPHCRKESASLHCMGMSPCAVQIEGALPRAFAWSRTERARVENRLAESWLDRWFSLLLPLSIGVNAAVLYGGGLRFGRP